ncbi:MAG: DUF2254 domain-containing protein [Candidatus Promineifilaceae bacterium]
MTKTQALLVDNQERYPYLRPYLREWYRDSLTVIPFLFIAGAILLFFLMGFIDLYLVETLDVLPGQIAAAEAISSVIAVSMLSFMGVIFSITLVALQLANQQFSPHIVRKFEGSGTVKMAMGLFIATFVYALLLLRESSGGQNSQMASVTIVLMLVIGSVIFFVIFVKEILQMLRIGKVIAAIVDDTHHAINENFPRENAYVTAEIPVPDEPSLIVRYFDPPSSLLVDRAPQGMLKAVNDVQLLRMAQHGEYYLRVLFQVGDHIMRGDPVVEVYGANDIDTQQILSQFVVGHERNLIQDPAFGFRQLVDIATHSLGGGVNLPSIAALVIDNLTELLLQISRRPTPSGYYADSTGQIRLLRPLPTWEDYVDLAFADISYYGANHPLVQSKLVEAYDRLLEHVPEDYKTRLIQQCDMIGFPNS